MAPTVTLSGTFEDILGNPVTTGTVTATLMGYGANIPRVAGVAIFDGISASATVSGSGTFTLGPLYGNDVITPGPLTTYYQITMPAPNGGTVTKNYQFSGSGSFDLSQLVPMGTPLRGDNTIANSAVPQVFSPVSHQFLTGMNSLGQFSASQPAASDLSNGTVGSGSVVLAAAVTGSGNAVLATSPTISGPTLTTPTIASIVNTGTLTLPTSTDTLVGRATTDTLTNKTLVGSANPAASGIVRLAAGDTIAFRNAGNSADIALSKSGYDQITATGLSNRILQNFTSTQLLGSNGLAFQAAVSKTIKANSLGAHGALLIRLAGTGTTAAGGTVNIIAQFGGSNKTVLSIPQSLTYFFRLEALICNQNQTGQQLLTWTSQYNGVLSTQSNNTYTIDTTADQTLSLGASFSNSSDNVTFQVMQAEIMPASAAI